jgi:hypothetical protein
MPKAKPVVPMDPAKKAAMLAKRNATKEQKAAATERERKRHAALLRWYEGGSASQYSGNTSYGQPHVSTGQGKRMKKGKSKRSRK